MEVRESQGSRWVRQGWSIATGREHEKVEKRKEKYQGRREGGSSEGNVPCVLNQEFLFLVHEYWGSETTRLDWSIGSYETSFTRKPCAKAVPEMDSLTQRKQYHKRTTLRTFKLPLRSIRSEEGSHYHLGAKRKEAVGRQATINLFMSLDILWWFHTWAVLRSLANARKCQLNNFCEKERYESCSVQWTFTADTFRKRQKRESSTVVMLPPGSHERLALRNPRVLFQKHGGAWTRY